MFFIRSKINYLSAKASSTELKLNTYGEMSPEIILKFENFEKLLKVPFVIYADFECYLEELDFDKPEDS